MVLNISHYLQDNVISAYDPFNDDSTEALKNTLVATSPNVTAGHGESLALIAEEVFQKDCIDTPHKGSFSTMWHVTALASILRTCVMSIYPDFNRRIRPVYHKLIYPRPEIRDANVGSLNNDHSLYTQNHNE